MASISQGTTFSFNGTAVGEVTRVTVNQQWAGQSRNRISTAHLGTSIDDQEPYVFGFKPNAIDSSAQVDIEYLGSSSGVSVGASGGIAITGAAGFSVTAATCLSCVTNAAVGDVIKYQATFRIPMG
jgi:hypothetical protein